MSHEILHRHPKCAAHPQTPNQMHGSRKLR